MGASELTKSSKAHPLHHRPLSLVELGIGHVGQVTILALGAVAAHAFASGGVARTYGGLFRSVQGTYKLLLCFMN